MKYILQKTAGFGTNLLRLTIALGMIKVFCFNKIEGEPLFIFKAIVFGFCGVGSIVFLSSVIVMMVVEIKEIRKKHKP